MHVEPTRTIVQIKDQLFKVGLETPRSPYLTLQWNDIDLPDYSTLQENNIPDGSNLRLVFDPNAPRGFTIQIQDQSLDRIYANIKVSASDPVSFLMTGIHKAYNIDPTRQILLYEGRVLDRDSLLSDYGFRLLYETVAFIRYDPITQPQQLPHDQQQTKLLEQKQQQQHNLYSQAKRPRLLKETPKKSSTKPANIFFQILRGVYTPTSPLHIFRKDIDALHLVFEAIKESMCKQIKWIKHGYYIPDYNDEPIPAPLLSLDGSSDLLSLNVNMMPIVMGDANTLPPQLKRYARLVKACVDRVPNERGKVGYLTIHESWVEPGETQRRPGLHMETPGTIKFGSTELKPVLVQWGWGDDENLVESSFPEIRGGIFMASSVSNSCAIWPCVVEDVASVAVDSFGGLEHLRNGLEQGAGFEIDFEYRDKKVHLLRANTVVWITDRTPHESLPVERRVFRQFFRLVTSNVTVWFADHSTPNPLGVEPNCLVVKGSKFDGSRLEVE
ncbi:UNVERIFIED_CONTAM: hypothetical protein HDU68_010211 [Siphonaria sp. JEL0065]|nr:hypothetical protein HDU68_010211 [Siphonaria sp. JEL0065]